MTESATADDQIVTMPGMYLGRDRAAGEGFYTINIPTDIRNRSFSLACDGASILELLNTRVKQLEAVKAKAKTYFADLATMNISIFDPDAILHFRFKTHKVSYGQIANRLFVFFIYNEQGHTLTAHLSFDDDGSPYILGKKFLRKSGLVSSELDTQDLGTHCVGLQN